MGQVRRRKRGTRLGLGAPVLAAALLAGACATSGAATSPTSTAPGGGASGSDATIGELAPEAAAIMAKPEYRGARWLYHVTDAETGEVLLSSRAAELVFTASTAKLFTVGSLYATRGPDSTITTPVYVTAPATGGVVDGDLVLVAQGDLALGGRGAMEGRVDQAFTATTIDHVYGDLAPNAALVPDDPLAGLDHLAAQVAAAGITTVAGDVVVDTRVWETFMGGEGPVPPIFVNDNILDLTVTGTEVGQPATVAMWPQTDALRVTSTVTTAEAGTPGQLSVTPDPDDPTSIEVSGTIAAGASQLTIHRVPDAADWARTLFVEALGRAGVSVGAAAVAPNDESSLPAKDSYPAEHLVAELTSPPMHAYGTMILETSYNTGANALLCTLAVDLGSTDCIDGLQTIHGQLDAAGLDTDQVFLVDGQGADPASTTPEQIVAWATWARQQSWGEVFVAGQPVLGETGTLASAGLDSPARGKVAAKTGTSAAGDPITGRIYYKVQSLGGYMTTDDGRELVLSLSMSGAMYPDLPTALTTAGNDVAAVAAAFQQALSQ